MNYAFTKAYNIDTNGVIFYMLLSRWTLAYVSYLDVKYMPRSKSTYFLGFHVFNSVCILYIYIYICVCVRARILMWVCVRVSNIEYQNKSLKSRVSNPEPQRIEYRISCLIVRISSQEFIISGLKFWVSNFESQILSLKFRVSNHISRVSNLKFWVSNLESWISSLASRKFWACVMSFESRVFNIESWISSLKSLVKNLESQISNLET